MELNTGATLTSKIVFELFDEHCPRTCQNFKQLCLGYQRTDASNTEEPTGERLQYNGTEFHRVVKGMYAQAGDLSKIYPKHQYGYSIYDGPFEDESFAIKHTEPGLLGMCKRKNIPNTGECQFYVTLGAPLSFLDGQTVIFGRIIEGFSVFKLLEKMDTVNEKPHPSVKIENSTEYTINK